VSGLDTTSVINQLMSIERRPVTLMQARQSSFNAEASAWGEVGSRIATLRAALDGLDSSSDFALYKATSSDPSILVATAGSKASPGSAIFRVAGLAAAHQVISHDGVASPSAVVGTGTATIGVGLAAAFGAGGVTQVSASADLAAGVHTINIVNDGGQWKANLDGGAPVDLSADGTFTLPALSPATGTIDIAVALTGLTAGSAKVVVAHTTAPTATAADLASAISSTGGLLSAQVISLDPAAADGSKLVVNSSATGTANALTVDLRSYAAFAANNVDTLRAASDAEVRLGDNLIAATRSTNSFTDLLPGVTLNLTKADPDTDVTVTVARDTDGIVAKVKALVDALNGVTSTVARHTAYNAASKTGGALLGDSTARNLTSALRSTVGSQLGSGPHTLFSQLGVSSTSKGGYTFDESKLRSALAADPQAVTTALTALAAPVANWARTWDGTSGAVAQAKSGAETESRALQTRIDAATLRLAAREERFRRQFGSLETLLGTLRNQSSWLASQINGLTR
jgi:flagellar capping protein FliD